MGLVIEILVFETNEQWEVVSMGSWIVMGYDRFYCMYIVKFGWEALKIMIADEM